MSSRNFTHRSPFVFDLVTPAQQFVKNLSYSFQEYILRFLCNHPWYSWHKESLIWCQVYNSLLYLLVLFVFTLHWRQGKRICGFVTVISRTRHWFSDVKCVGHGWDAMLGSNYRSPTSLLTLCYLIDLATLHLQESTNFAWIPTFGTQLQQRDTFTEWQELFCVGYGVSLRHSRNVMNCSRHEENYTPNNDKRKEFRKHNKGKK